MHFCIDEFVSFFSFQGLHTESFIDDRSRPKRNISPVSSSSEQRRVRQMIDRLESSSSGNTKVTQKVSTRKSFDDDHTNDSTGFVPSPPSKRVTQRETEEYCITTNGSDGGFVIRHKSPHNEVFIEDGNSNVTRFDIDRNEILNTEKRTASGTNVSIEILFLT